MPVEDSALGEISSGVNTIRAVPLRYINTINEQIFLLKLSKISVVQ